MSALTDTRLPPVAAIDGSGMELLPVDGRESLARLRALLAHLPAERVLLVVPVEHAAALTDGVWLKALARQAGAAGKEIALFTSHRGLRRTAESLSLSTFDSESRARAATWQRPRTIPDHIDQEYVERVRARRVAAGNAHRERWNDRLLNAGLLFALTIVMGSLLLLLVPGADIQLQAERQALSVTLPVVVNTTLDELATPAEGTIAGQQFSAPVQGTLTGPTTGRRDLPAARASGEVLFVNVAGEAVTIPAGTIVSTSAGTAVRFRTTGEVTLPAELNGTATAPVEAVDPGPSGNVQPFQIRIVEGSAANEVRVLNEGPIEGGDVQQQNVVTQEDKDRLRDQLEQQLLAQGQESLATRLQREEEPMILLPGSMTIQVTAETYSASLDDAGDELTLDLRAQVTGVAISREALEQVGSRALQERVPDSYGLDRDTISTTAGDAQRGSDGLLRLALRADGSAVARLLPSQVRELVRGKSLDEAHELLEGELPLAVPPTIDLSPAWWSRLPLVPLRISVAVNEAEAPVAGDP